MQEIQLDSLNIQQDVQPQTPLSPIEELHEIVRGTLNIEPLHAEFDHPQQRLEAIIQLRQAEQLLSILEILDYSKTDLTSEGFFRNATAMIQDRIQTLISWLDQQIAYNTTGTVTTTIQRLTDFAQSSDNEGTYSGTFDVAAFSRLGTELRAASLSEIRTQLSICVKNISTIPSISHELTSVLEAQTRLEAIFTEQNLTTIHPDLITLQQTATSLIEGSQELVASLGTINQLEQQLLEFDPVVPESLVSTALEYLRQTDILHTASIKLPDPEIRRSIQLLRNLSVKRYLQLKDVGSSTQDKIKLKSEIQKDQILGTNYPEALTRLMAIQDVSANESFSAKVIDLEKSRILSPTIANDRTIERFKRLEKAVAVILDGKLISNEESAAVASEIRRLLPSSVEQSNDLGQFSLTEFVLPPIQELRAKSKIMRRLFSSNDSPFFDYNQTSSNLFSLLESLSYFSVHVNRALMKNNGLAIEGITVFLDQINALRVEALAALEDVPRIRTFTTSQLWDLRNLKQEIRDNTIGENRAQMVRLWRTAFDNPKLIQSVRAQIGKSDQKTNTGPLLERINANPDSPQMILGVERVEGRQCLMTPGAEKILSAAKQVEGNPYLTVAANVYLELVKVRDSTLQVSILQKVLHGDQNFFSSVENSSEETIFSEIIAQLREADPASSLVHLQDEYSKNIVEGKSEFAAKVLAQVKKYLRYDIRHAHPEAHYTHERVILKSRAAEQFDTSWTSSTITAQMQKMGLPLSLIPLLSVEELLLGGARKFALGLNYVTSNQLSGEFISKDTLYPEDDHSWLDYLAKNPSSERAVVVTSMMRQVELKILAHKLGCEPNPKAVSEAIAPWVLAFQAKNFWNNLNNYANRDVDGLQQQNAIARYDLSNDGNELPQKQFPCSFVLNGTKVDIWGQTSVAIKIRTYQNKNQEIKPNDLLKSDELIPLTGYVRVTIRPDDLDDPQNLKRVLGRATQQAIHDKALLVEPPLDATIVEEAITDITCSNLRVLQVTPQSPLFSVHDGKTIRSVEITKAMSALPIEELARTISKNLARPSLSANARGSQSQSRIESDSVFTWITSADSMTQQSPSGLNVATLKNNFGQYRMPMIGGLSVLENSDVTPVMAGDHAALDGAALGSVYGGIMAAFEHFESVTNRRLSMAHETSSRHKLSYETNHPPTFGSKTIENQSSDSSVTHAELPVAINFAIIAQAAATLTEVLKNPEVLLNPQMTPGHEPLREILQSDPEAAKQLFLAIADFKDEYANTTLDDRFVTSLMTVTELGHEYERITNAIAAVTDMIGDEGVKTLLTEIIPKAKFGQGIFQEVSRLLHTQYRGSISSKLEAVNAIFAHIEAIVKAPLLTKIVAKELLNASGCKDMPLSYATMKAGPFNLEIYEYDTRYVVCVEGSNTGTEAIDAEYIAKCFMEITSFYAKKKVVQLGNSNSALLRLPDGIKPVIAEDEQAWMVEQTNDGMISYLPVNKNQKRLNLSHNRNYIVVIQPDGTSHGTHLVGQNVEARGWNNDGELTWPVGRKVGVKGMVRGFSEKGLQLDLELQKDSPYVHRAVRLFDASTGRKVKDFNSNAPLTLPPGEYKFFIDTNTEFAPREIENTVARELMLSVASDKSFEWKLVKTTNLFGRRIPSFPEVRVNYVDTTGSISFAFPESIEIVQETAAWEQTPISDRTKVQMPVYGIIVRIKNDSGKYERYQVLVDRSVDGGDVVPNRQLIFNPLNTD
ncbi:MAG: hypothetical protein WAU07_04625 [Microgenomates group bacterium]